MLSAIRRAGVPRAAALALAAFLILVVNREFGVADNGDFSRYTRGFTSKPYDLAVNWPEAGSSDWDYRFFRQPIFYWSPPVDGAGDAPWLTSATPFWEVGRHLNNVLHTDKVLDSRYAGLPFFLLHALGLFYVLRFVVPSTAAGAVVAVGAFLVFTDARLSASYNSFYAQSVPILALLLLSAYFFERLFSPADRHAGPRARRAFGLFTLAMLGMAIGAQRQYVYFLAPALLLAFFLIASGGALQRSKKILLCAGAAAVLTVATGLVILSRQGNASEADVLRISTYNALYYGMLPQSDDPAALMAELGLPADSAHFIGRFAWTDEARSFIESEPSLRFQTVLRAISVDPAAFARSILHNAGEVGRFDIPLGMVFGEYDAHPPALVSASTVLVSQVAGLGLLAVSVLSAVLLMLLPRGASPERRLAGRVFAAALLLILVTDVVISAFDGQQEARKHVLVASATCLVILVYAAATLADLVRERRAGAPPA